ncbi:hypothetical protein [Absidia glauca]|uniref:Uncharacterized protein n=1 Tax=Absidia glauca TaxID=4829 RepID=A0A163KBJ8_ABSGL|nr:hypothetical protein [Absidia glauca]
MLPQIGYIVAQAGADSRPSHSIFSTNHSRSSPPPPSLTQQQLFQQQQTKNQPTYTMTLSKETPTYTNAPPPPPPPPPTSLTGPPVLLDQHPSSLPYMYSTASSQGGPNDYYYAHSNPPASGSTAKSATNLEHQPTAPPFRSQQQVKYPWQQQQQQQQQPPHDPYMDYSYHPPSLVWHNAPPASAPSPAPPAPPAPSIDPSSDNKSYSRSKGPTFHRTPPPPPPSTTAHDTTYDSSYYIKHQPPSSHPPSTSTFRWHQDDTLTETKMFRRLREYNDLMAWMDNEFWDQNDEVYQEKLLSLRQELKSIQEGDHAAFQEMVADLELIRDQTISNALCFENYQMTVTKQGLDLDVMLIEDEYKKQSLRKRIGDDRSPRQETSSRGRRLKHTTASPHNINAPLSYKEDEDIEAEYLAMKGNLPRRAGVASRR